MNASPAEIVRRRMPNRTHRRVVDLDLDHPFILFYNAIATRLIRHNRLGTLVAQTSNLEGPPDENGCARNGTLLRPAHVIACTLHLSAARLQQHENLRPASGYV